MESSMQSARRNHERFLTHRLQKLLLFVSSAAGWGPRKNEWKCSRANL